MKRVIVGCIIGTAVASAAIAAPKLSGPFDKPMSVKTQVVKATKDTPKTTITCSYFAKFMVKQVDEGEVGAAQLSIVPIGDAKTKPACQRANAANEAVVKPDDWGGYFKGVKGDFVFFDSEDGINGADGFAVFSTDAKKLFDDNAQGKLETIAVDGTTLTMTYQRSFAGPCSVAKDGAACWSKIAAATGVKPATDPGCTAGYLKAKNEMAQERCKADGKPAKTCLPAALKELDSQKWDESPSVVTYEAQTVVASGKPTTTASGPALTCHPAD